MKSITYPIQGRTDSNGVMKIENRERMEEFFRGWPNESVILEARVLPKEPSKLILSKYFRIIVPLFQKAYEEQQGEYLTLQQTDLELRKLSPVCITEMVEDGGIKFERVREVRELSQQELVKHLKTIEIIGAREFEVYWT